MHCYESKSNQSNVLIGLFLFPAVLTNAQVKSKSQAASGDLTGGGKYIVEQVALCVECHTPRDEKGTFSERNISGAHLFPLMPHLIRK